MKKTVRKDLHTYICPFCGKNVLFSKKTEISYQNHWINGCNECFALSINEQTMFRFQEKIITI